MPEKTLKEKVIDARTTLASERADMEEARQAGVYQRADDYETDIHNINVIEEALTALEERVKELEKDKLTLFERQALSVVLTWQDGGWNNNERLRKAMLVFYATCKEQYPDIIYGIRDLSEEAPDGE